MNTLTTEQIREILAGAPDGYWSVFVNDRITYIQKPTGESWACGYSHNSTIEEDAKTAVNLLNNAKSMSKEILALRERVEQLIEAGDGLIEFAQTVGTGWRKARADWYRVSALPQSTKENTNERD